MVKKSVPSQLELQRLKVESQTTYGLWTDRKKTIEFKIFPTMRQGSGVKIWRVHDLTAIKKIARICRLDATPKRTHWEGFDFAKNLRQAETHTFVDGVVHMPGKKITVFMNIEFLADNRATFKFYFPSKRQDDSRLIPLGSIDLSRLATRSNTRFE